MQSPVTMQLLCLEATQNSVLHTATAPGLATGQVPGITVLKLLNFVICTSLRPQAKRQINSIWPVHDEHLANQLWALSNFTKESSLTRGLCQILLISQPNHWGEFISNFGFLRMEQEQAAHKAPMCIYLVACSVLWKYEGMWKYHGQKPTDIYLFLELGNYIVHLVFQFLVSCSKLRMSFYHVKPRPSSSKWTNKNQKWSI